MMLEINQTLQMKGQTNSHLQQVTSEPSCDQTPHHVDSIFVERVPGRVFRVMHQNFGLEGPLDGALFETLT